MKVCEKNNDIILENVKDFNLTHIFECGQCFRWNKEKDGFFGIAMGEALYITQEGDTVTLHDTNLETYNSVWKNYFDLETDYGKIKKELSGDKTLKEASDFGYGIRLLRQDAFECLISFIISASNNIPRIKKIIESLCQSFGEKKVQKGRTFYLFPTAEKIASLSLEELGIIKAGFRDKYILAAANAVYSKQIDLECLKSASFEYAKCELLKISGVGEKVASCILLFGLQKYEGFPIDVWIKRILEYCWFDTEQTKDALQEFAKEKFGDLGGFAQQYLFYWARENKIGI